METRGATSPDKSRVSAASKATKKVRYARLADEQPEENDILNDMPYASSHGGRERVNKGSGSNVRKHEIYENTSYIPNTKVRILETPMSSSLSF
jgi:hypothetical protein